MTQILIAEDEQRIASFIEKGLSANGFAVTTVGRRTTARRPAISI
jgi:two-component system copper resistance phosphate regulon response regulator CusR